MNWLRKLFCWHNWKVLSQDVEYAGNISFCVTYDRTRLECKKCGKYKMVRRRTKW